VKNFTSATHLVRHIAESTIRRLSLYLQVLESYAARGSLTISSDELAAEGGTTPAQVRKDLSFFGSFGKRGFGYSVPELSSRLREILGLGREWRVVIIGAGKIGSALAQYGGFRHRGFSIVAVYDNDPRLVGKRWDGMVVRDIADLDRDTARDHPDIAVVAVPAEHAQAVVDRAVGAGIKAILNFAPAQIHVPRDVVLKSVNMAMELEGLTFMLANREAAVAEQRPPAKVRRGGER
jgi:redox-sensing transcriptional repressor